MLKKDELWKVKKGYDRKTGKKKELPEKRTRRTYQIIQLEKGKQGLFHSVNEAGCLLTSLVSDYLFRENELLVRTENTLYFFEKYQTEETEE